MVTMMGLERKRRRVELTPKWSLPWETRLMPSDKRRGWRGGCRSKREHGDDVPSVTHSARVLIAPT